MSDFNTQTQEVYKLAQSNQAKLGRFFEVRDQLKLNLNATDSKNLNILTQQYTDVMYLTRDLESISSYTDGVNKVAFINNRLNEIDQSISALSSTSIPELKSAIDSIRHQDLKNKVNSLSLVSFTNLDQERESIIPSSSIQNTNSSSESQVSKQESTSNINSQLKPPDWGIKFTVTELTATTANQILQLDSPTTKVDKEIKDGPYRFGPLAPVGKSYYVTLLPAMASQLNLQGARDVPNAMPGLNFKIIPNIAKLKVPGFQPIYQNLGIDTVLCTLVGCFTGADGISEIRDGTETPINKTQNFKRDLLPYKGNAAFFKNGSDEQSLKAVIAQLDSFRNFQEFYEMTVLKGKEVKVEINLAKTSGSSIQLGKDKSLRAGNGNPKFQAVIKSMETYHSRSDRTWYTLQLEITDFGLASKTPINLTNKLNERIKAAQIEQQKLNGNSAEDEKKKKEAEEYLKKVNATQYKLKDGTLLYKTDDCNSSRMASELDSMVPCREKWFLQNGTELREITDQSKLEKLKSNRSEISPTTGDWLSLVGSGFGCGVGIGTIIASGGSASLLVGAGTAVACGGLAVDLYNLSQGNTGKSTTEGVIDLGLNVIPATKLGTGGLNLIKKVPGVTRVGRAAGNIVNKIPGSNFVIGRTTSILDTPISQAFPKTQPFLESAAQRLNPKNYSIFNRGSGVSSTAAEVFENADEGATFLGPLGNVNNTFKSVSDFLIQSKAATSSGARIILQDGRTLSNAKISKVFDNQIIITTPNNVEYVSTQSIKSIQLGTGEIWRLP